MSHIINRWCWESAILTTLFPSHIIMSDDTTPVTEETVAPAVETPETETVTPEVTPETEATTAE